MATVRINGLVLKTVIGIQAHELQAPQDIVIDVSFEYDASKAAATDNITDAVDYSALKNRIETLVVTRRFNLVERLARELLNIIMEESRINQASVTVTKPGAISQARGVSVTLGCSRKV